MTENDYIAEYVKERCPEVIQTIDYSLWRLRKAASVAVQTMVDHIKAMSDDPNDAIEADKGE